MARAIGLKVGWLTLVWATAALMLLAGWAMRGLGQAAESTGRPVGSRESLLIGPGDLLHITAFDEPGVEQRARVTDAGWVPLQMGGEVMVAGLTPADAARAVGQRWREAKLLNHPLVSVVVEEYATQAVTVMGEVVRPGAVLVTAPRSVVDVIALAGGFDEIADRHVTIRRRSGEAVGVFLPGGAGRVGADAAMVYPMVYPGDTVVVPRAGIVYVLGDVGHPGGYPMRYDSKMTVLQALALAAGTNKTAAEGRARLVRGGRASPEEMPLALKRMERGEVPDVELQADDVIYVPFSMAKNLALGGTAILAAASSAIIYTKP